VIRVMLVEEVGLLRGALEAVLAGEDDVDVVAALGDGGKVLAVAAELCPDVLVLDLDLPNTDAVGVAQQVGSAVPGCAIVALTARQTPAVLNRALRANVRGFLGKDLQLTDFVRLLRAVAAGERVIDPTTALEALRAANNPLTTRERDVLRAAADGLSTRQIAGRLFLTEGTVRNYLSAIQRKTGAGNRWEAIGTARDAGWL
jgi:two-component system response regulator DesR